MLRRPLTFMLAWLALAATPLHAGVIYATGFESPAFSVGTIQGQDGWSTFNSPAASTVQNTVAAAGTQAVRVDGSVGGQHGAYYSTGTAAASLLLSADLLLSSASSQSAWQFAAIGPGLVGFAGGFNIINGTTIQAITAGFPVIGTLARDVWNHLDIYLDFDLQQTTIVLNGSTLASGLAFCGDNGPCAGASVAALGTILFDSFGSGQDAGYMDNLSLSTVPEPGTLALVGAAVLGAMQSRRRLRAAAAPKRA
jgi:hypothetical protein